MLLIEKQEQELEERSLQGTLSRQLSLQFFFRYVCRRVPVSLDRTTSSPPPTCVHPFAPHPEKEFPLSVYSNTSPLATYEMTIIRQLENDETNGKFYKVHMSISKEDYDHLIETQKDPSKKEVHQRRYYFVNGRQPVVVIKNLDDWLLNLCQENDLVKTGLPARLTPAWVKVCTEGSNLIPLPKFLNVNDTIRSNSMEYTISVAAGLD